MFFLRVLLTAFGLSAIAIAFGFIIAGPAATANAFNAALQWVATPPPMPAAFAEPSVDNEFRFYAVFWGAYGLFTLHTAQNLPAKLHHVPTIAALFFAAGLARIPSLLIYGAPHPMFLGLMAIELTLPLIFITVWHQTRSTPAP